MIGHNPKVTPSDDLQEVVSLLQDLPQITVPVDFNTSLYARIATAKAEASEFADVVSLMKELPRVSAPADFDFRLRARLAQAKSEQQKAAAGWWPELFGRTFSWAQAGAAMAAVAVIISVVTLGVLRSSKDANEINPAIASGAPASEVVDQTKPTRPTTADTRSEDYSPKSNQPMALSSSPGEPVRIKTKATVPTAKPTATSPSLVEPEKQPEILAAGTPRTVIIKHRSGEARVVNLSEYNLGLQTASVRATPITTTNKEAALAANIF